MAHGSQSVNFNTRIDNKSSTQIDVVLTNMKEYITCNPLDEEEITDHKTIEIKSDPDEIGNDKIEIIS